MEDGRRSHSPPSERSERSILHPVSAANGPSPLFVLGRFPPPIDGQTMATERTADLLTGRHDVRRLNTEPPISAHVAEQAALEPARLLHFFRLRRRLREALRAAPYAPVLWPAVSPAVLGHARDVLVTLPALGATHDVYAIVHRGNFDVVFRRPSTALTARRMVRRLRGFVFLNDTLSERCAPWIPPEKRFVIPNTIGDDVRCSGEEVAAKLDAHRRREHLRLLFLSNMIPSKGYLDALEAVRLLHERGVAVRADFAGRWASEADRQDFDGRVEAYGLRAVLTHHGGLADRARIKALYLEADVFVLPTYYPTEAQPLSILEAMNAATPVVTTRQGGIPEMVENGREGRLVPPRAPKAIADAIERLQEPGPWSDHARQARRRFEAQFSPDAVRAAWLALLDGPRQP